MQCLLLTTLIVTVLTASPNLPSHTHGVAGMTRGKAEATITDDFRIFLRAVPDQLSKLDRGQRNVGNVLESFSTQTPAGN